MTSITERYFTILKDYFGQAYKIAVNERFNSSRYLKKIDDIYCDPILANSMIDSLYHELSKLDWASLKTDAKKITGLKTVYIGAEYRFLKPISAISDFLRKTALYSDTILIADDIYSNMLSSPKPDSVQVPYCFFRGIIRNAIKFLALEHLFLSDSTPHICTLVPPANAIWNERRRLTLTELLQNDELSYASDIFQKHFSSKADLENFFIKVQDFNHFLRLVKKPELFLSPTGEPISIQDLQNVSGHLEYAFNIPPSLKAVLFQLLKIQHKSVVEAYAELGSNHTMFSTDFKGVWETILWLLENNSNKLFQYHEKRLPKKDEIIMQTLQQEDLKWLGNIPINKINALRERGELEDLRNVLGKNIQDLEKVSDEEFFEISQRVKYNIEAALRKHDSQISDLKEKYRSKYKLGGISIVVSGTLAFASALYPPVAVLAAAVGGGTVVKTVNDYFECRRKSEDLRKKPVGLLFDVKKQI